MKLIPLNCRQCGAPLSVPEDVKHVTCGHCGTQLGVVHEGGAAYTEKLEQLDSRTCEVEQRLEELTRKQAIAELDQAWEKERQQYLMTDKFGGKHEPAPGFVIIAGVLTAIGVGFAVLIPLLGGVENEVAVLALFAGFVVGGVGLLICLILHGNSTAYQKAEQAYRQRRAALARPAQPEV